METDGKILHEICQKMKRFDCMMRAHANRDMEAIGITGRQADILFYLMDHKEEKVKQVMIEKAFRLSNPTVTGVLNRLEQNGFLTRELSEKDRRCNYIVTTEKTEALFEEMERRGSCMEQNLFEGVSPEQTEAFMECLDLMYGNLEAMCARQEKAHVGTENCRRRCSCD